MKEIAVEGTFTSNKGGQVSFRIDMEARTLRLTARGPRDGSVLINFSDDELKEIRDFFDRVGPVLDSGEMASLL